MSEPERERERDNVVEYPSFVAVCCRCQHCSVKHARTMNAQRRTAIVISAVLALMFAAGTACEAAAAPVEGCTDISGSWKSDVVSMQKKFSSVDSPFMGSTFLSGTPISMEITVPEEAAECFYIIELEYEDPLTLNETILTFEGVKFSNSTIRLTEIIGGSDGPDRYAKLPIAFLNVNEDDGSLVFEFLGREGEDELTSFAIEAVLSPEGQQAPDSGAYGTCAYVYVLDLTSRQVPCVKAHPLSVRRETGLTFALLAIARR